MRTVKQVLRPERLRQVPAQFSWVDHGLVQQHFIDRCDSRSAALYLFLLTVADAQGLSFYGAPTLARRLHLSPEELLAARQQLIELDLIAYRAPLYQVLALAGTWPAPRPVADHPAGVTAATSAQAPARTPARTPAPAATPASTPPGRSSAGPVSLAELLAQMERRRDRL